MQNLCSNPYCCPIRDCKYFHKRIQKCIKTLVLCEEYETCRDVDCRLYHPKRPLLVPCPFMQKCNKWYCRLDHMKQMPKLCMKPLCKEENHRHRPNQDGMHLFKLSSDVMFNIFEHLTFSEWKKFVCSSYSLSKLSFHRSSFLLKFLGHSARYKFKDSYRRIELDPTLNKLRKHKDGFQWKGYSNILFQEGVNSMIKISLTSFMDLKTRADKDEKDLISYYVDQDVECVLLGYLENIEPTVGMMIDVLDHDSIWYEAVITRIADNFIRVHFIGWSEKWDMDICSKWGLYTKHRTYTTDWRLKLKVGDKIEYKGSNNKWYEGIVTAVMENKIIINEEISYPTDSELIQPIGVHTPSPTGYKTQYHVHQFKYLKNGDKPIYTLMRNNKKKPLICDKDTLIHHFPHLKNKKKNGFI